MNKNGFTLLEVTLFLAISGMLGLIAFIGLGPRLRNVRFTQSVRLIENTINSQFAETVSGQNMRPPGLECNNSLSPGSSLSITPGSSNAGTSSLCVINGKMVVFSAEKMTFYSIVSRRLSNAAGCSSASTFIETRDCFDPRVIGNDSDASFSGDDVSYSSDVTARFPESPASGPQGFGYVQSPNGINKFPFYYNGTNIDLLNNPSLSASNSEATGTPLKMCLELFNREAELTVANNQIKPEISFEGCTI